MKRISSADNPTVKLLHALATSSRERRKLGQTLLDGAHLVDTWLIGVGPPPLLVVSESGSRRAEIAALLGRAGEGTEIIELSDGLFARVSPVDTPAGIMAVIDIPPPPAARLGSGSCIVLDAIQEPGNLGTLLRTAAAAGIRDVLLGEGCAQAWSPRALRAGMGAHLALAIHEPAAPARLLAGFAGDIVATAPDAPESLYELDLRQPVAWLFGNEGAGLSPEVAALATRKVCIPMADRTESLNVSAAAAVCLFEQVRQNMAARKLGSEAT
ncbi:MAG: RNA methyltransferase [Sterolibacteriaceae bacterium]|uniref:RNA methyltransferase n=1 Tax=Candidatus Methylophosphatis roskildensis TaxID=2899263 RepID=A0A9D7HM86_9PROT|nr:RNA methyltransferase [Candidatus Methylophosphatis roskildensis]MBK7237880.1 RNA methyltransferase [Sterolibacteriaceae bacterium]